MSPLRVGVLGCGEMGARHAAAVATLPDELRLVACCGRDAAKTSRFAATTGATPFLDFRQMSVEVSLDLLIVALPPYAHDGEVEAAAAAGVHLLVEKPIALDMTRASAMVEATTRAGVRAACGFMYRHGAAVLDWEAAAAAGEIGRPGLFIGQFHCNALHAEWWRERGKSGGQLVEQLIHLIDLARHQLGEPDSVYARAANLFHRHVDRYDIEDVSAIMLGYDDGRIGVLNATNAAIPGQWNKRWQIVAERMAGDFAGWNTASFTHTLDPSRSRHIDEPTDVFVAQLVDLVAAIRDERPPRVPLSEGAASLRVALAAVDSAVHTREIRL